MLVFFNNFYASDVLLHDLETDKYYLLIAKNASTSLKHLSILEPNRFKIVSSKMKEFLCPDEVFVFLREPIDRFLSGITTQCQIYRMDIDNLFQIFETHKTPMIMDAHTGPQFWSILSYHNICNSAKFCFYPLSMIGKIFPQIKHMNVGTTRQNPIQSQELLDRLIHFYTEDIVLFNQFMDKSVYIEQIIDQIKQEKGFVENYKQYQKILTYLL